MISPLNPRFESIDLDGGQSIPDVQVDFFRNVYCVLGLPFDAIDLTEGLRLVRTAVVSRTPFFFSTPNLNFVVACQKDADFRTSVINSELSVADGMPIVWIARLLGVPLPERVAGSSLFEALRQSKRASLDKPIRVFFFGGADGVAKAACARINGEEKTSSSQNGRGLICVGYEAPGFCSIEEMSDAATIRRINASQADFLVVSLGARKGQAWIQHNRQKLNVPVVSHLGAVVNFIAGNIARAPQWVQRFGLEWIWRILEEPKLWRRYFEDGMVFLGLICFRVIPLFWYFRISPIFAPNRIGNGQISVAFDDDGFTLKLAGVWVKENLQPLQKAFQDIPNSRSVTLDLGQVTKIDSSFLGLLILMYGRQLRDSQSFVISAASKTVVRVCKLSCTEYLLR